MIKRILLTAALVLTASLSTASAGDLAGAGSSSQVDSDCAKARAAGRTCNLVFDGDDVSGDRPTGQTDEITVAQAVTFSNLINVRTSFRDMIVKSADEI